MVDILNLSQSELAEFSARELDEKPFRAAQIWQWLWQRGARDFEQMTDLSKGCRELLTSKARIRWPEIARESKSEDGVVKLLLRLDDAELVETVLIPGESRTGVPRMTQCLSTQVGCAMGCVFCGTGSMGFTRNMTQAEILGQVLVGRAYLGADKQPELLRNLVFMGMGEPLMNFTELMRSLETLNSGRGLAFSPRRITVSTCGIKKGLRELGESNLAYLAISLHAPEQELREQLMPAAKHWPLPEMLDALSDYPLGTREKLTLEYILLSGVNDSLNQAAKLARIAGRLGGKINLIAYNPIEGLPYKATPQEQVLAFERELRRHGVIAILRKSKGREIKAACGQLRAEAMRANFQPVP